MENERSREMNAYELAKLLDFDAETLNWKAFADAANMLRQQADRIAEYEKQIKQQAKEIIKLEVEAQKHIDRIAELEKFTKAILKKGGYPYKPLSDEEIEKDYQNSFDWDGRNLWAFNFKKFAKAIEERHGIK